jgi:hypothetical protein
MNENWSALTQSTSSAPDGNRRIWDLIWKADVASKVQHVAWCLVTDSLPTWLNKHKRTLENTSQCPVCDVEIEDNFHPFIHCTLAKQCWEFMVEKWSLPKLQSIEHSGTDWLLILLGNLQNRAYVESL